MTSALVLVAGIGLFPVLVKLGVDIVHRIEVNQQKAKEIKETATRVRTPI
jgi:hypothetical protein